MDDGTKIQLPKQILQTQKYHIIMQYKRYCDGMYKKNFTKVRIISIIVEYF